MEELKQFADSTGKPIVIMDSPDAMVFRNAYFKRLRAAEIQPGMYLKIDGRMKMPGDDELTEHSVGTMVLDYVLDQSSAWDLLIIEGEDALYVSYEPYRQLIRERGDDFDISVVPVATTPGPKLELQHEHEFVR
jgi:hypothetical protein